MRDEVCAPRWACPACAYCYDATRGDPEHGVPAQTIFTAVPETWVCPWCGAKKKRFKPEPEEA